MPSRRFIHAFAAAALAAAAGCGGSGLDKAGGDSVEPVTLTLAAYAQPDPDPYVEAVTRLSRGAVRIRTKVLYRDGQPDYEEATIADVQRGDIDLALVGARAFDLLGVKRFQGLLAPFLVDSFALQRRVLESELAEEMLAGVDRLGVVGLGLFPGPLRRPVGLGRPLTTADDYGRATVGVRPSALVEQTFRALGATPKIAMFPSDFRVVSGIEYDVTGLDFSRYDGPASAIVANVVYWPKALVLIANRARFEQLSPAQRALLRRAASEALAPALDGAAANEDAAVRALCGRNQLEFVRASAVERGRLRAAVEPVYAELRRDGFTRRVLDEIESLRGSAQPETLRCPRHAPVRPGARASLLAGTWEWSVTRAELLAAGDRPAGAGRNVGRWRMILHGGRYEVRNLDSGDAYEGTYRIVGHRLIARGTGEPTAVGYIWSVYRGRMALKPVDPNVFAAIMIVKPLKRVS